MKKSTRVVNWGMVVTILLTAVIIVSQQPVQKCMAATRLPDLTITKVYLVKDCRVAVEVKNLGPGYVPNDVWTVHTPKSAGVYLYKNGTGWGGGSIWKFDPAKNLQKPGGTATYVSKLRVSGTAAIKAVVDLWDVVPEANEGNNSLEVKLTCEAQTGPQPGSNCTYTVRKDNSGQVQYVLTGPGCKAFIAKMNQQQKGKAYGGGNCEGECHCTWYDNLGRDGGFICRGCCPEILGRLPRR